MYTEGIEVKCKDEELNAKLYNNRASAHYHLGKVSFILYLLNALSTLRVVPYLTFYCLFCIFALLRKDTPGTPIQLSLLTLLMLSGSSPLSYYHLLVMRTTLLKPKGETVGEGGWSLYREFQPRLKEHTAWSHLRVH